MPKSGARREIRDIVNEIIAIKSIRDVRSPSRKSCSTTSATTVLGYGAAGAAASRGDDIADIMVNGANTVYIEVNGKIQPDQHPLPRQPAAPQYRARRIVKPDRPARRRRPRPSATARLPDGLARQRHRAARSPIDGPSLTIRKFKKDKLTLDQLVKFGSISPEGGEILKIIGHCRAQRADLRAAPASGKDHAAQLPDELH